MYYERRAWATLKHLVKLRARLACGVRVTDRVALLDATPPSQDRATRRPLESRRAHQRAAAAPKRSRIGSSPSPPTSIYGLPSALLEVASALADRGQTLAIERVFTSGELLRPAVRDAIADAFQARVFDIYGSSETKEIAWECPEGAMHVNADVIHLEVLDDDGRPLPVGVEGNLVATSLVNHAMPLLRYRVGDRGSLLPHRLRVRPLVSAARRRDRSRRRRAGAGRRPPRVARTRSPARSSGSRASCAIR